MCWPKCSQRNCRAKKTKGTFKCSSDLQHSNTCLPSVSLSQDVHALKNTDENTPPYITLRGWYSLIDHGSPAVRTSPWQHSGPFSLTGPFPQVGTVTAYSFTSLLFACDAPFLSVPVSSHTPDLPALSRTLIPPQVSVLLASAPSWHESFLHNSCVPTGSFQSVAEKVLTPCSRRPAVCPCCPLSSTDTGW